jgi:hypothetical protein
MIKSVVQSSAIVASMFPSNVRARLYKEQENVENRRKQHGNLASYLNDGENGSSGSHDKPLADLFTETTVLVRMKKFETSHLYDLRYANERISHPFLMSNKVC